MYELIYNKNGENKLISIPSQNIEFPINEENRNYKKYLIDIENGVEVIDNPPSDSDILEIKKAERINDIDRNTNKLIVEGISHNGINLSMSDGSQINFTILKINRMTDSVTVPRNLITKEDSIYPCETKEELDEIIQKMEDHKEALLMSGGALKVSIKSAIDLDKLDLIEDNR